MSLRSRPQRERDRGRPRKVNDRLGRVTVSPRRLLLILTGIAASLWVMAGRGTAQESPAKGTTAEAGADRPSEAPPSPAGADPRPAGDDVGLRLRNVYVPADRLEEFTRGFLPIRKSRFEELTASLKDGGPVKEFPCRIALAEYYARLEGESLVNGQARLHIEAGSHRPAVLDLSASRLPLSRLAWVGTHPEPARIIASSNGARLPVAQSGAIIGSWSLRSVVVRPGEMEFAWRPPTCLRSTLVIDAPDTMELSAAVAENGAAFATVEKHDAETGAAGLLGSLPNPGAGQRRWRVELGGDGGAVLRLRRSDADAESLVSIREETDYRFGKHALDVATTFRLDIQGDPLDSLELDVPEELLVTSVRVGDAVIPYQFVGQAASASRRLVVPFSQPLSGVGRVIQIAAIAPLRTGDAWRMPRIVAQNGFWQDGIARMAIHPAVTLERMELTGCRQSRYVRAASAEQGESRELQLHLADAVIEVVLKRRPARLRIDSGVWMQFESGRTNATLTADISAVEGEAHALSAMAPASWILDSIETEPADMLEPLSASARQSGAQVIQLRLRRSVAPGRPLRIRIRGRRAPLTLGVVTPFDRLRFVEFREAAEGERLVALTSVSPQRIKLTGDAELDRLDGGRLALRQRDLLPQAGEGDTVFRDNEGAMQLGLASVREKPAYAADLALAAVVTGSDVREIVRLKCEPSGAEVGRVLVHFSVAREEPIAWSVADETESGLTARRLSAEEQSSVNLSGGETWQVDLRRPRRSSFLLSAMRRSPRQPRNSLSLAWLPEASAQTATLAVYGPATARFSLETKGAKATAADGGFASAISSGGSSEQSQVLRGVSLSQDQLRAAYRYEPGQAAEVVIAPDASPQEVELWCWDYEIESWLFGADRERHRLTLRMENRAGSRVEFDLPKAAEVVRVLVDGQAADRLGAADATASTADAAHSRFAIPLPQGVRRPIVAVEFTMPSPVDGAWIITRSPPQVRVDVPVLRRRWVAHAPRDFAPWERQEVAEWRLDRAARFAMERLAGPLWPARTESGHTAAAAADRPWTFARRDSKETRAAEEFLSRLGQAMRQEGDNARWTWRRLIAEYEKSSATRLESPRRLFVDPIGLSAIGVHPDSFVPGPLVAPADDVTLARALLEQSGAAVLVGEEVIVLGAPAGIRGLLPAGTAETAFAGVVLSAGGRWNRRLRALESELTTASAWASSPSDPAPRGASPPAWGEPLAGEGWRTISRDVSRREVGIEFYRPRQVQTFAAAMLLGMVALSWLPARRQPRWMFLVAGTAAAAALLAPEPWAPIATAAFQGVVISTVAANLFARSSRMEREAAAAWRLGAAAAWAFIGLGAAFVGARLAAQDVTGPTTFSTVIRPIDEQQREVGDYVYLPQQLYDDLQRRLGSGGGRRDFDLLAASYHASLEWRGQTTDLGVESLQVKYHLQTLRDDVRVVIPLSRAEAYLPLDGARLDQRTASADWDAAGKLLTIVVPRAGEHQLELNLLPSPARAEDAAAEGFEFGVLAHPEATLLLRAPANAPAFQFPGAMGAAVMLDDGTIRVDLGPTNRFGVRWPSSAESLVALSGLSIDQRAWFHVRPGHLLCDLRLSPSPSPAASANAGALGEFLVHGDGKWKLASSGENAAAGVQVVETRPGEWRVTPERDLSARAISLRFIWPFPADFDRISAPRIDVEPAREGQRWFAVSCAPSLMLEENWDRRAAEPIPADVFVAAWEDTPRLATSPQWAYRWTTSAESSSATWTGRAAWKAPVTTAGEQVDVSVGRRHVRLRYEALLETTGGELFMHRLNGPADLMVESVSLVEQDEERVARWAQTPEGEITVFLNGAVSGPQRLLITGRGGLPTGGKWAAPQLTLVGARRQSWKLRVYRRSDALLESAGPTAPPAAQNSDWRPEWGRLYAEYAAVDPVAVEFSVRQNRPRVSCVQITRLEREHGVWMAEIDCRWAVNGGLVDAFRLELPAEFAPQVEAADAETAFESTTNASRRRLIVRPDRAASGEWRLTLKGPCRFPSGVSAPDILPLDSAQLERYVQLPTLVESRQVAWSTSGLQPGSPPSAYASEESHRPDRETFRAGDEFHATIKDIADAAGEPQVRLADIRVAWDQVGDYFGVADFDLQSAGVEECTLRMPRGARLVSVRAAELPAQAAATSARQWKLKLGPAHLPQRISVVFTGRVEDSPSRGTGRGGESPRLLTLNAPELVGIPVEHTLWTLRGPASPFSEQIMPRDGRVDPLRQEMFRLRTISALLAAPLEVAADGAPGSEVAAWKAPWLTRFAASRAAVDQRAHIASLDGAFDPVAEAESHARELGLTGSRPAFASADAADFAQAWVQAAGSARMTYYYAFQGAGPVLELPIDPPADGATTFWLIGLALSAAGVAALAYRLAASSPAREWFSRWPQLAIGLLGAVWWMWLTPELVGLAILLVAVVSAVWPGWRRFHDRPPIPFSGRPGGR